ncbi:MAG: lipocalin family protein [Burkholderiales bacterium]|nr:lipocalin family protein [Burkholderiales bacterium]
MPDRRSLARAVRLACIAAAFTALSAAAADPRPLTAVPAVDPARYVGQWYEIARFPAWFQKRCKGDVTARYALRDDGRLDVENRCVRDDGTVDIATAQAKRADGDATGAKLRVSFLPAALRWLPFGWANYWVVDLDPDYAWAVVSEPGREYLWVLARTPSLPAGVYDAIVARLAADGFAVDRMVVTTHAGTPAVAR